MIILRVKETFLHKISAVFILILGEPRRAGKWVRPSQREWKHILEVECVVLLGISKNIQKKILNFKRKNTSKQLNKNA